MGLLARRIAQPSFQPLPGPGGEPAGAGVDGTSGRAPFEAGADRAPLVEELEGLRARVTELEADLARYHSQDVLLNKSLVAATSYAARIREEARRESQLALSKARARVDEVLGGLERERIRAERELLRLQRLTDETRTRLSVFLTEALAQLRVEGRDGPEPSPATLGPEEVPGDISESTLRNEETSPSGPPPWLQGPRS